MTRVEFKFGATCSPPVALTFILGGGTLTVVLDVILDDRAGKTSQEEAWASHQGARLFLWASGVPTLLLFLCFC